MLCVLPVLMALSTPPVPATAAKAPPPPANDVSRERLEATLRALPTRRAAGVDAENDAGLLATEELVLDRARQLGLVPRELPVRYVPRIRPRESGDVHASSVRREWRNIIIEFPGVESPQTVLLVGAHIDAVPDTPGADDNGTGVSALLEIARVLKDRPVRRTIRLAFFNLEEVGLVGSSRYAADWAEAAAAKKDAGEASEEIIGMISLEMLGYYSDEPGSQTTPFGAIKGLMLPTVGDSIALVGVLSARPFIRTLDEQMRVAEPACRTFVFDLSPIAPPDLLRSDHAPFMLRGIAATMVTDTANFRNPHYHQPTDTVETLDLNRFTVTVRALAGAIYAIAGPVGQPDPPPPNLDGLPDLPSLLAPKPTPRK